MRLTRARDLLIASATIGLVLFACSSDDDWSYDGPRSACSTGAPSTDLPQLPDGAGPIDAPECVARCGESRGNFGGNYGSTWSIAALPSGACSYDGEVCSMAAVQTRECPDGRTVGCAFTGYTCRCESGTWRCYSGVPGASACVCSIPDGAAPDAGIPDDAGSSGDAASD